MIEIIIAIILIIIAAFLGKSFLKLALKDMIVLAIFMAFSVIGRYLVSYIPSVQPSSYLIITAGLIYGPAAGFFTGIGTALLSNLLLGMGPYVAWQMLCWGAMGLIAGFLYKRRRIFMAGYGFVWGFVFGWITNLWYLFYANIALSWAVIWFGNARSFPMDLAHAVTNLVLLLLLPHTLIRKLLKVNQKEQAAPKEKAP